MARKQPDSTDPWKDLTWDNLEAWSGSVEKGRSYQRSGRVHDLRRSENGTLLAWVHGTQRYATQASLTQDKGKSFLGSVCTCPVGSSGCKHGVAVVLAYLETLKKNTMVPVAEDDDPRWELITDSLDDTTTGEEEYESEDEYEDDDEDEDEDEDEAPPVRTPVRRPASRRRKEVSRDELRAYLEGLSATELAAYLLQVADRHPEVASELADRRAVARSDSGELIRKARKEINRLTGQQAWVNKWTGEGSRPNYSNLGNRFEQLLEMGQADMLLELGADLFEKAQEQVGSSDDEGETGEDVAHCMAVVARALPLSSRSDRDKLLYLIDLMMTDEYGIADNMSDALDGDWPREAWSEVADEMARRLSAAETPKGDSFHARYARGRLSGWLIEALEMAGRNEEVLAIYEQEARANGEYTRLVDHLIEMAKFDDAWQWAMEGIEKTPANMQGIVSHLSDRIRDLAAKKKDWPTVAALRAEEFFQQPGIKSLEELEQAARKAGCLPAARAAALRYLETGERPTPVAVPGPATTAVRTGRKRPPAKAAPVADDRWPLPLLAAPLRRKAYNEGPHLDVLLELAIQDKRPDDVLHWFDKLTKTKRPGWGWGHHWEERVADAVVKSHPERSLEIYRKIVDGLIAQTSPSSYQTAMPTLRKIQQLLHNQGKDAEWKSYLGNLRQDHARKRRLMEVLDRIENPRIVN